MRDSIERWLASFAFLALAILLFAGLISMVLGFQGWHLVQQ
jgi:hypothetical protein